MVWKKIKGMSLGLVLIIATGLMVSGCYESYDPKSYAPKFTISGFFKYGANSTVESGGVLGF